MPYYAQLNDEFIAYAVSELSDVVDSPGLVAMPDLDVRVLGQRWTEQGWAAVEDPRPTLTISLAKTLVTLGEPLAWQAEIRLPSGALAPVSGHYFVPVIRSDGKQATLLKVTFSEGQAAGSLALSEEGVYSLDFTHIRPVPTSLLGAPVEWIVEP